MTTTLFQPEIRRLLGSDRSWYLSLQGEANFGTWFSGGVLLLAALYAVEAAWRDDRRRDPGTGGDKTQAERRRVALGWMFVAVVVLALSADEVGQFHEFIDAVVGWGTWWSMLPFAVALLGLAGAGILALWSATELRWTVLALLVGFATLATVPPLLEVAEHSREWGLSFRWTHPSNLRGALEEGSELLGILILLHAYAWGRSKTGTGEPDSSTMAAGPDVAGLRRPLLVAGWPAAIVVTLISHRLPPDMIAERWVASSFFLVAVAIALARPTSIGNPTIVGIGLAGSAAATVFDIWSPVWPGLAAALLVVWLYLRLRRPQAPAWWAAALLLALGLLMFNRDWPGDATMRPALPQFMGLATLALTVQRDRHRSTAAADAAAPR